MAGSEKRQRQNTISFRCTAAEQQTILACADKAGLSVASFCRSQILGTKAPRAARRPTVNQTEIARLIGQMGQLADSIEDLKLCGHDPVLLDAIARDLSDICVSALQSMGRGP